jgi:hypothetical protein
MRVRHRFQDLQNLTFASASAARWSAVAWEAKHGVFPMEVRWMAVETDVTGHCALAC